MKKTLLIACLIAFSAGAAMAQQQGGPGNSPGFDPGFDNPPPGLHTGMHVNAAERLTENLGLNEAQAAEIAAIFEEARLLQEEERERARLAFDAIRANVHAQIMQMLTAQQQIEFQAQVQRREELRLQLEVMRAEHGFGGGHGMGNCIND